MENFELARQSFYEGVAHLERAEYALAEAKFYESLKQVPDRVSTLTNLALALIKQDKIGAAREICLKVLSIENNSPEGWLNLGLVQAKEGDHVQALISFDKVAAGGAEFAEVWLNKGISLRELARHEEAAACFRQSIGVQPANAAAHFNLGLTLEALNQTDSALTSYGSAIGIDPGFMAAKYQIFSLHLANLADVNLIERLGVEFAAGWSRRQIDAIRKHRELSDFRMLHELEQTGYLLGLGYESEALVQVNACLQKIYTDNLAVRGHSVATRKVPLSAAAMETIVRYWENPVRYTTSPTIGSCLNPDKNWHEV
jgi:tetratricopeptide (TPR) repeat protein